MLHDVALRPILEQPAGKHPSPLPLARLEHVDLHKRAGFLRIFPLRGALATAQPHDGATNLPRFSRLQRQFGNEPVSFVEEAQHRDAVGIRRYALVHLCDVFGRARSGFRGGLVRRRRGRGVALASGDEQSPARRQHQPCMAHHAPPGVHGR